MRSPIPCPPLLRAAATDEFDPLPASQADQVALAKLQAAIPQRAAHAAVAPDVFVQDRRATATTLREIDAAHGGGWFRVGDAATWDVEAADADLGGSTAVVDVQTHLVDARQFHGPPARALSGFLQMVDPQRWADGVDARHIDAAAWAALVFGASETAIALLTSTPGLDADNVLTGAQIAVTRDLVARYSDIERVLTHTIVHPNHGTAQLDAMVEWRADLRPSAWKVYTLSGPPTAAAPTGGWFLDDEEVGGAFLQRVEALGPRIVCAHKGLGGPIPDASVAAASPRDIGPAAKAFPSIDFVVYHSGYERDPGNEEGAYEPTSPSGVDRLVASLETSGIRPGTNVWAELGSTWYLMLRRPQEAAHVLGKLLCAVGPDRILWGTDSAWYGSPQPLIDAFRAFCIPEWMCELYGYPRLDTATKELILGVNAAELYGLSAQHLALARADHGDWPVHGGPALRAAVRAAGRT